MNHSNRSCFYTILAPSQRLSAVDCPRVRSPGLPVGWGDENKGEKIWDETSVLFGGRQAQDLGHEWPVASCRGFPPGPHLVVRSVPNGLLQALSRHRRYNPSTVGIPSRAAQSGAQTGYVRRNRCDYRATCRDCKKSSLSGLQEEIDGIDDHVLGNKHVVHPPVPSQRCGSPDEDP